MIVVELSIPTCVKAEHRLEFISHKWLVELKLDPAVAFQKRVVSAVKITICGQRFQIVSIGTWIN